MNTLQATNKNRLLWAFPSPEGAASPKFANPGSVHKRRFFVTQKRGTYK